MNCSFSRFLFFRVPERHSSAKVTRECVFGTERRKKEGRVRFTGLSKRRRSEGVTIPATGVMSNFGADLLR